MNWIQYLWEKLPELSQLGNKDLQLSKLVARIHRKRSKVDSVVLLLKQIHPLHAIDRDTAMARLAERVSALKQAKLSWSELPHISREQLNAVLPSVSAIKVIQMAEGRYVAFEGNGRLYALKSCYENMSIEVDLYVLTQDSTITRRVERVLELNGLNEDA